MPTSAKTSYLVLRLGLAFVFIWFGVDKFIHPSYWVNAWVPLWFVNILNGLGVGTLSFIYLNGIFEIIVGLGFVFNVFIKPLSILASLFLVGVIFGVGLNEVTIRDVGLLGGTLAVFLWRERR